jgi:hypothetical protein
MEHIAGMEKSSGAMSPRLIPVDDTNTEVALGLLEQHWGNREFWQRSIERMRLVGGNSATGVPIGQIAFSDNRPVGVVLTPASWRTGPNGEPRRFINISSQYIEPSHRWLYPLMMRSIMRDPTAVFTDLTPDRNVQRMLLALGFKALNEGEAIVVLPYAVATRSARARVVDLRDAPGDAIPPATRRLLEAHRPFGCIVAALAEGDVWQPLLFKNTKIRRLPAVRLTYCENNAALYRNLGAVARHLLRRGKVLLTLDIPLGGTSAGIERRHRGKKFAKGDLFQNRTDYAGSELALFDL